MRRLDAALDGSRERSPRKVALTHRSPKRQPVHSQERPLPHLESGGCPPRSGRGNSHYSRAICYSYLEERLVLARLAMRRREEPRMVMEIRLGDVVRLRKPHPCGSLDWSVVRLGADIGLRCVKCNHRVLLDRAVLERRMKQFVSRGSAPADLHSVAGREQG